MARAPVDLPEREPLRRRGRGVERDRTGDEGQLQIALPVGSGCWHRKTPKQQGIKQVDAGRGFNGRKQLGFQPVRGASGIAECRSFLRTRQKSFKNKRLSNRQLLRGGSL